MTAEYQPRQLPGLHLVNGFNMIDPRLQKWADTLVNYSLELARGEQVLIRVDEAGIPLAREVYRSVLSAGGYPHIALKLDDLDEALINLGSAAQLDWVSPIKTFEYNTIDALVAITAQTNTAALSHCDPLRQTRVQKADSIARRSLFARTAAGKAKWVLTMYPTPAGAQNAGLSLLDYESFLFRAMFLDQENPGDAWRSFSKQQQKRVDRINGAQSIVLRARDTEIRMSVSGRTWLNSDGHRNFPSGEIFTSPHVETVEGHVRFGVPSSHLGHEVEDIRLTFLEGEVVEATAGRGQKFLDAMLETDAGARRLGEVAIGNNYAISFGTRNTLFDEKIGGTFHLALGSAYGEAGGTNQSALHWDMVCDMRPEAGGGSVEIDGSVVHQDGRWVEQLSG